MKQKEFFRVYSGKYQANSSFWVVRPASLNNPKEHAVMFITTKYPQFQKCFLQVKNCLIFWPEEWIVPNEIAARHAVVKCKDPHLSYCKFFAENEIDNQIPTEDIDIVNGAYIAKTAKIGKNTKIFPGAYIGGDVEIGDKCFIGSGVKIIGRVSIGNQVYIRENTVIGADGLSTDRDESGHPVTMPQFGGVIVEDNVRIGANSVIARGAIDDTVLQRGCKIDNLTFISHNVCVGEESFVVGQTLLFGSASVGRQAQISGGCVVGNYVHIGDRSLLGMGSAANKSIPENTVAYGVLAKPIRKRFEE